MMKDSIYEVRWQQALLAFVKHHNGFVAESKAHITILSLGTHNCFEGPDFQDACLQINGQLLVGDVEFHKKSSDWITHNHQHDPNYSNVILHIVFENNKQLNTNFETIVVSKTKLKRYLTKSKTTDFTVSVSAGEDYKYYAMLRLLRRTEEVFNQIKTTSLDKTFSLILDNFLDKYNSFKIRPITDTDFPSASSVLKSTELVKWLHTVNKSRHNITNLFNSFINNTPNIGLHKHLKQEILTNVILPIGFCLASKQSKTELLLWYWSAKTRSKYGILNRLYPLLEQRYIWQQQGMLEHYKEYYKRQMSDALEFLKDGDVSDYVNYFELAKQPYKL